MPPGVGYTYRGLPSSVPFTGVDPDEYRRFLAGQIVGHRPGTLPRRPSPQEPLPEAMPIDPGLSGPPPASGPPPLTPLPAPTPLNPMLFASLFKSQVPAGTSLPTPPAGVDPTQMGEPSKPGVGKRIADALALGFGSPGIQQAVLMDRRMQHEQAQQQRLLAQQQQAEQQRLQLFQSILAGQPVSAGVIDVNTPPNPVEGARDSLQLRALDQQRQRLLQAFSVAGMLQDPRATHFKSHLDMVGKQMEQLQDRVQAREFVGAFQQRRQALQAGGREPRGAAQDAAVEALMLTGSMPAQFQHLLPDKSTLQDQIAAAALRLSGGDDQKFIELVRRAQATDIIMKREAEAEAVDRLWKRQELTPELQRVLGTEAATVADAVQQGWRIPNMTEQSQRERLERFLESYHATEDALQTMARVSRTLESTPAAQGLTGAVAAAGRGLFAQAQNLASIAMGPEPAGELFDKLDKGLGPVWQRLGIAGIENRALQSEMLGLAFLMASAEGVTARNLTATMVERILQRLGAEQTQDPRIAVEILNRRATQLDQRLSREGARVFGRDVPSILGRGIATATTGMPEVTGPGAPEPPAQPAQPQTQGYDTPEAVRDALRAGQLSREEALKVLRERFGFR